jgi:hypothetical protein
MFCPYVFLLNQLGLSRVVTDVKGKERVHLAHKLRFKKYTAESIAKVQPASTPEKLA